MSQVTPSPNSKPSTARLRGLSAEAATSRDRTEEAATRLALLALRHWERGLAGIATVPAAAAITTGAGALFVLSLVEQMFGLTDATVGYVGAWIGEGSTGVGELRERPENGTRAGGTSVFVGARSTATAARSGGQSTPSRATPGARGGAEAKRAEVPLDRADTDDTVRLERSPALGAKGESPGTGRPPTGSSAASSAPRKEPEEAWELVLLDAGGNPIALIRELRELTGRDLRDIEALVDSVPEVVSRSARRAEAEALGSRIEAVGGRIEVRRRVAAEG